MTNNNITIIITSFKSDNKICKCLDSIDSKYKILVVENSQNLLLKEKLENRYPNVQCIIAGKNLGYAKGNNLGLSKVNTTYALILNPDTIVHKDAIANFLNRAKEIKSFAIIAPAIQDEKNEKNNSKKFQEVDRVKGFAFFLRISEFNEIGFFDDNFFIYLEEIDLCNRLINKNKKIFVDPQIIITHQGGSSHDEAYNFEMELSRNWHWMWSTFYYLKKYKGFSVALILTFKKFFSSTIKYLIYLLTGNKVKRLIYKQRMSGLFNAMIGNSSWYRPFNEK